MLPNFLVWKFCGKPQFSLSFGLFAQNFEETVPFRKMSKPRNLVKFWYFAQGIQLLVLIFFLNNVLIKVAILASVQILKGFKWKPPYSSLIFFNYNKEAQGGNLLLN